MKSKITLQLAALTAAALMLPQPARAEVANTTADLAVRDKIAAYINSKEMLIQMSRLGQEQDAKLGIDFRCTTPDNITPINTTVIAPIDLPDDAKNPVKGAWMLRYVFNRCGNDKIYNAVIVANASGAAPTVQAYYPGAPRSGPRLIKNAMPSALAAAELRFNTKTCKDVTVYDMRVAEEAPAANAANAAWKETWTFRACGKLIDVPVSFSPNPSLGGIDFAVEGITGKQAKP